MSTRTAICTQENVALVAVGAVASTFWHTWIAKIAKQKGTTIQSDDEAIQNLNANIEAKERQIQNLKGTIEARDGQIQDLMSKIKAQGVEIQQRERLLIDQAEKQSHLETTVESQHQEIKELQSALSEVKGQMQKSRDNELNEVKTDQKEGASDHKFAITSVNTNRIQNARDSNQITRRIAPNCLDQESTSPEIKNSAVCKALRKRQSDEPAAVDPIRPHCDQQLAPLSLQARIVVLSLMLLLIATCVLRLAGV